MDEHKDEFEAESARRPLQRFFQEYVDQEPEASFRSELERLEFEPVSALERTVATRSLARYGRQGVGDDNSRFARMRTGSVVEDKGRLLHCCHEEMLHCGDGGP